MSCCLLLVHAVTAKVWHFATGFRMEQVRFLRHVVGDGRGQPRSAAYFTPRPARSWAACNSVCVRIPVHLSSTSASVHERTYLDLVARDLFPKIHTKKQFTSLSNISDLSLLRCFVPRSEEFVSLGSSPT